MRGQVLKVRTQSQAIEDLGIDLKQDDLVSGENIKTVNGSDLLGSGNLTITGTGGSETVSFLAATNIAAYKVVTSNGQLADSSSISYRGKVIGITTAAVLTGFIGTAKGFGMITNSAWSWTIGDRIFLNGTTLSTTAPSSGFIQFIGTAIASDTIDIQIGLSVLI